METIRPGLNIGVQVGFNSRIPPRRISKPEVADAKSNHVNECLWPEIFHIDMRSHLRLLILYVKCICISRMTIWVFPKIGIPKNGWFMKENPIKMDDLGVPLFSETSIYEPCMYIHAAFLAFHRDIRSVSGGGNPHVVETARIRDLSGWLDHAISFHGATLGAKETGIFHLCQETWIFHGIFP